MNQAYCACQYYNVACSLFTVIGQERWLKTDGSRDWGRGRSEEWAKFPRAIWLKAADGADDAHGVEKLDGELRGRLSQWDIDRPLAAFPA